MSVCINFVDIMDWRSPEDAFVGKIPAKISNSRALLRSVASALSFPSYFGENWNALFDCLRDLNWIGKRSVIMIHEGLPSIPNDELAIYLGIINDAANDWRPGEEHELIVVFDNACRESVMTIMRG